MIMEKDGRLEGGLDWIEWIYWSRRKIYWKHFLGASYSMPSCIHIEGSAILIWYLKIVADFALRPLAHSPCNFKRLIKNSPGHSSLTDC